jgi:Polysaccharide deacetylase
MGNINQGILDGARRIGAKIRELTIDGGISGSPLGLRIRGATSGGAPQSGTWKPGDHVEDRYGATWINAAANPGVTATPAGTWVPSGVQDAMEGPQVFDRPGFTYLIAPSAVYTVLTASSGLTITQDTTDYEWGTQSIKMQSDGIGGSNFGTITFSPPLDLSEQCLAIGLEIDSFTPYNDFQIRVSSDGFASSNFTYCHPIYTGVSQRWVEPGVWEQVTLNWGGPAGNMSAGQWVVNGTGVASLKSVSAIRFKLVDNGGSAPMVIRLGYLAYFQRPAKAIVTLAFDDSRLTQYTIAKPAMDVYGIQGTCYNIGYDVINSAQYGSAYFSQAQLLDMQANSGWEIAAHAYTDGTGVMAHTLGYDSLTAHDGSVDVIQLRNWLRSVAAQGIDDFALPHGQWDLNLFGNVNPNTNVLGMMRQYFNTCRTTYGNTIETYPPADRGKLRCYVAQSTDTASTIMAIVNAAVANKWWLILVFHNLPASTSGATDFAAAQFQSLIPQLAAADVYLKTVGEVMKSGVRTAQGLPTPLQFRNPAYVADANYTVTSNNDLVAYTSLSAARTVTLPAVTALSGKIITVKDESGSCSGTVTITLSPPSGTIDGASSLVLAAAYATATVYTDGANYFTQVHPYAVPGGSSSDLQYNNSGSFGGDTATTDGSGNLSATTLTASSYVDAGAGVVVAGTNSVSLTHNGVVEYLNPNMRFSLPSTEGFYWYNQGRGTNLLFRLVGSTGAVQTANNTLDDGSGNATLAGALAMGSHKITGLTNGSGAQDGAAFGQIPTSASQIGGVTSVAAGDTSVVVGGTAAAPTIETGTLDVIAADHPPAGNWSNNSHKITSLANGSGAQDAAAYGQTPAGGNTVTIAEGGTGQTTANAGFNALSPMTTLGDEIYGGASGAATRLAGNTTSTKNFLTQTGNGSVSAAPAWGTIAAGDLPAATTSAQGAVELDGTIADITADGTAAAGSTGKAADAGHVHPRASWWTAADYGFITMTMDPAICSNTVNPTAGTLGVARVHVPVAVTVTNVLLYVSTAGSGLTSGQNLAGLYNSSGTLLSGTADQTSAWASTGLKTIALTSSQAVAAGDYYIGFFANGTTPPLFARAAASGSVVNVGLSVANSRFATGVTGNTTTMPASMGTLSPTGTTSFWAALS